MTGSTSPSRRKAISATFPHVLLQINGFYLDLSPVLVEPVDSHVTHPERADDAIG